MGAVENLLTSAGINIAISGIFLGIFIFFSRQPVNGRVYFTKWYAMDAETGRNKLGKSDKGKKKKFVETNITKYFFLWQWAKEVLTMPEDKLIDHAGLDSAVYLRLLLLGMKILIPVCMLSSFVLIPINYTDDEIDRLTLKEKNSTYSVIDKLTISNVRDSSPRLWSHVVFCWLLCFWVLFLLHKEYSNIAKLRFKFMSTLPRSPDQFTVLVRQVPNSGESVKKTVDDFFKKNHPDGYLFNQVVYNANKLTSLLSKRESLKNSLTASSIRLEKNPKHRPMTRTKFFGLVGKKVDAIDYYTKEIEEIDQKISDERKRVLSDKSCAMPTSFVSFNNRRAASVAAQTQQCRDATKFITQLAPEPNDVAWSNQSIKYTELTVRQLIINVSLFFLIFFYIIPVSFVQSLANLDSLKKKVSFLRSILNVTFINSIVQGFLPGLALKIFLAILPQLLIFMSNIEGWISKSIIERKSAGKYFYFMLINVFFASILTGSLFQQLKSILSNPKSLPKLFGSTIPSKATFFQTYIMLDGWVGVFVELSRISNLIIYHIKSMLLVRTPQDRDNAMSVSGMSYVEIIPQFELYILLGLVYSVITPLLLPFVLIFFFFAYFVYRNQVINVYEPDYESSGAFWPHVHGRMICALVVQQLTMIGFLAIKKAVSQGPWLLPLPVITLIFHYVFCKGKFENAFTVYALEEAVKKDQADEQKFSEDKGKTKKDQAKEIRRYLRKSYLHPSLKASYEIDEEKGGDDVSFDDSSLTNINATDEFDDGIHLVPLKRYPMASKVAKPKLNSNGAPNSILEGGHSLSASSYSSHASLGTTNQHEEDLS